jgi:hypothetical protein
MRMAVGFRLHASGCMLQAPEMGFAVVSIMMHISFILYKSGFV